MYKVVCKVLTLIVVLSVGAWRNAWRDDWRSDGFMSNEMLFARSCDDCSSSSFEEVLITPPTTSCHCSSIAPLPQGKTFTVWYGGSREGAKDVNIYSCVIDKNGNVSNVRSILDAVKLGRQTNRYVRKLGNPVVYRHGSRLWLFVVSVSCGGWSGSSLNYAYSDDDGESWSRFKHLRTNPLFNMGTLVRQPAVSLCGDGFILPAYNEFLGKFGVGIRFASDGRMVDRVKILADGNRDSIQPCCVTLGKKQALAFSRTHNRKIAVSETLDGGFSWKGRPDLTLDNPDASVAAFKTARNQLVIVGNPKEGRCRLIVWTNYLPYNELWREALVLESSDNEEFSYPFACVINSDVYVSYTYDRVGIKIVNLTKKLEQASIPDDYLLN